MLHPHRCNLSLAVLLATLAVPLSRATTWYVAAQSGADANPGDSDHAAWRSLQRACDAVRPGDTVVVSPGVYFGPVRLERVGKPDAPIVFAADAVARGRVVVTCADPALRAGKTPWTLVDGDLQLYNAPCDHFPARVLYDGVDLLPFHSVDGLRSLMLNPGNPGAFHGFAWDAATSNVFVRLHRTSHTRQNRADAGKAPSGRYGVCDPNAHTMAVGPAVGEGRKGDNVTRPEHAAWSIVTDAPAHVVLDGFTFETPGVAGVYVRGSDVTVRNSWFEGCYVGVSGEGISEDHREAGQPSSDRVVVEACAYSQYPAFSDALEVIAAHAENPSVRTNQFFWWQRKGQYSGYGVPTDHDYETGLLAKVGTNWVVRNCLIRESFDGISHKAMLAANGLTICSNRFERIVDDAIETENHGLNLRIHDNEFVDCFVTLSWQPLDGLPWPGPIRFFRNRIWNTPDVAALRRQSGHAGAWLKAGAADRQWTYAPSLSDVPMDVVAPSGVGLLAYNNTVFTPSAMFLERSHGSPERKIDGFVFVNNVFVTEPRGDGRAIEPYVPGRPGFFFDRNVAAPPRRTPGWNGADVAGPAGRACSQPSELGLLDPAAGRFEPTAGSIVIGLGAHVEGEPESHPDAGAVPWGASCAPMRVGPQPRPFPAPGTIPAATAPTAPPPTLALASIATPVVPVAQVAPVPAPGTLLLDFEGRLDWEVWQGETLGARTVPAVATAPRTGTAASVTWALAPTRDTVEITSPTNRPVVLPKDANTLDGAIVLDVRTGTSSPLRRIEVRLKDARGESFSWGVDVSPVPEQWQTVSIPVLPGRESSRRADRPGMANKRLDPPAVLTGIKFMLAPGASLPGALQVDTVRYEPAVGGAVPRSEP